VRTTASLRRQTGPLPCGHSNSSRRRSRLSSQPLSPALPTAVAAATACPQRIPGRVRKGQMVIQIALTVRGRPRLGGRWRAVEAKHGLGLITTDCGKGMTTVSSSNSRWTFWLTDPQRRHRGGAAYRSRHRITAPLEKCGANPSRCWVLAGCEHAGLRRDGRRRRNGSVMAMRKSAAQPGRRSFSLFAREMVAGVVPWWITGWRSAPVIRPRCKQPESSLVGDRCGCAHPRIRAICGRGRRHPGPACPTHSDWSSAGLYRYVRIHCTCRTRNDHGQALILGRRVLLGSRATVAAAFIGFVSRVRRAHARPTDTAPRYEEYRRTVPAWYPAATAPPPADRGIATGVPTTAPPLLAQTSLSRRPGGAADAWPRCEK
jgi:hypothetical protein